MSFLDYLKYVTCQPRADKLAEMEKAYAQTTKVKQVLGSCWSIAHKIGEGIYLGFKSPIQGVALRAIGFVANQFKDQVAARNCEVGHIAFDGGITAGGGAGVIDRNIIRTMNWNAKKMGLSLKGAFPEAGITTRESSTIAVAGTESLSFLPVKAISLNRLLLQDRNEVQRQTKLFRQDSQEKDIVEVMGSLTRKPGYVEFMGTRCLAAIKSNAPLIEKGVELAAFYVAKTAADYATQKSEMDPSSWSFAVVTGLFASSMANLAKRLIVRRHTYKFDREAVKTTEDLQSAVECLRIVGTSNKKLRQSQPGTYRMFQLESLLLPSEEDRIKALDPDNSIPKTDELELFETQPEPLTPKEQSEYLKLKYFRLSNMKDVQLLVALKENKTLFRQLLKDTTKWCVKTGLISYGIRQNPIRGLILAFLLQSFPKFRAQLNPFNKVNFRPYSNEQSLVNRAAREMEMKEGVEVGLTKSDLSATPCYCASGYSHAPQRVVQGPSHSLYKGTEDFIYRHELRHIQENHGLLNPLILCAAALGANSVMDALEILPTDVLSQLAQGVVTYGLARGVQSAASRRFESSADRNAIMKSPPEKREELLKQGIAWLRTMRHNAKIIRNNEDQPLFARLVNKVNISPEGNNRFDIDHPKITDREAALIKIAKELNLIKTD